MGSAAAQASIGEIISELIALQKNDAPLEVFGSRISALQYRPLYEAAREAVRPGSGVLDWGCGRGHFSYFLIRSGYRVTGFSMEGFPRVLESHREAFTFVPGDVAEPRLLPFADAQFDAVFSVGVLEHVRETLGNEPDSLREIRRILRPGGVFVCAHLPNRFSWNEFVTRLISPSKFRHRYRFRKRDIIRLWGDAGLTIRSIRRYAWLPRNTFSRPAAGVFDHPLALFGFTVLEGAARVLFHPFHQNFLVVAEKPASGPSG